MVKVNTYTCLACEKEFEWEGYKRPEKRRCLGCSIQRIRAANAQMIAKKGPFYEKWKRSMKAATRRL